MIELYSVVFLCFVFCVQVNSFPIENVCSINGTCTATVTGLGDVSCSMKRVRNTVRYVFYDSNQQVAASLLVRPDLGDTFLAMGSSCASIGKPLSMTHYKFREKTKNGYEFVFGDGSASMELDENYLLLGEQFTELPGGKDISIKYTSVSYEYFDDGDYFRLTNDQCPKAAAKSTDALSSIQCVSQYEKLQLYYNMCSSAGIGTATVAGNPNLFYARAFRVSNYVRYDLYVDSQMAQPLYASLIIRHDLNSAFYYNSSTGTCSAFPSWNILDYEYNETVNGLDIFNVKESDIIQAVANHSSREIVSETVPFYDSDTNDLAVVTITYNSIDSNYEHNEIDDLFSIENGQCPQAAEKPIDAMTAYCWKLLSPVFPSCAFEYDINYYGELYHLKVLFKNKDYFFANSRCDACDISIFTRCDIKDVTGRCLMIYKEKQECEEGYIYLGEGSGFESFEYYGEPEKVSCPDGTTGCKKYSYNDSAYIIVDEEGRYVENSMQHFILTYSSAIPSANDFEAVRCNGDILSAPVDPCADYPSFSSSSSSLYSSSSSSVSSSSPMPSSSSVDDSQVNITDWWVEIELEEGIEATKVNATALIETISIQSGLDVNDMAIRIETDEQGYVVRVIVYVKNEEAATSLSATLNDMDKGDTCQYDILCKAKSVSVHIPEQDISGAPCIQSIFDFIYLIALLANVMAI